MTFANQLDLLHRYLSDLWSDDTQRPGQLSYSEYEYLRAIERLDGARVEGIKAHEGYRQGHHLQSIVAVLGVQKASASAAIARLEKRGLVKRFPCQFDSRAQHIMLTPEGQTLLTDEAAAVYGVAAKRLSDSLTPAEATVLQSVLEKIDLKKLDKLP